MPLFSVHTVLLAVLLRLSNPNQIMSTMQHSPEGASDPPKVLIGTVFASLQDQPVSLCSAISVGTGFTRSVWMTEEHIKNVQGTLVPTVH